jgi:hypothetical protein
MSLPKRKDPQAQHLGVSSILPVFCIRKIVCAWTADWHSATVSTQHCSCRPPFRCPVVRVAQCRGKEKTPRGLRAWGTSLLCLVIAVSLSKNVIRDQGQRPDLTQPSCEPQPFRCPVKRIPKWRAKRKPPALLDTEGEHSNKEKTCYYKELDERRVHPSRPCRQAWV